MTKLLQNGHAEVAPPLDDDEKYWYLLLFGMYHSHRTIIESFFYSSAKYKGLSLNVLMPGPVFVISLVDMLHISRHQADVLVL